MRGKPHYANSACIRITLDPKLHLAITSDRVVTETSNLDLLGKKTWGVYHFTPADPCFPGPLRIKIIHMHVLHVNYLLLSYIKN